MADAAVSTLSSWNKGYPAPISSVGGSTALSTKPVPMKLFSTWEVEKSTPSCIPRLCSLTLTRLVVHRQLEPDLQSLIVAIKMQSSKRVLRSNEILINQPSGLLDTEIDLSFSLQYPHFLKRDGNRMEIMLQRRKRYKNRTILGYKTLASGHINMSQVLQYPTDDLDMTLYSTTDLHKEQQVSQQAVARLTMTSLTSQPVDHDDRRHLPNTDLADRSPGEMSDEEEREYPEYSSSSRVRGGRGYGEYSSGKAQYQDYSSNDENSDTEALPGEDEPRARKHRSASNTTFASRQRNLKEKFVSLLRRFKVNEDVLESVQELGDRDDNSRFVEDLLEDVENLSDSDPDIDTISVHSTPKPKLRPFFQARQGSGPGPLQEKLNLPPQYLESERLSDDSSNNRRTESDSNPDEENRAVITSQVEPAKNSKHFSKKNGASQQRIPQEPTGAKRRRKASLPSLSSARRLGAGAAEEKLHKSLRERRKSYNTDMTAPSGDASQRNGQAEAPLSPQPRRVLLDQIAAILSSDNVLPECIVLLNGQEWQAQVLAQTLQSSKHRTVVTNSAADVKAVISAVVTKIQKYCSKTTPSQSQSLPLKLAIVGGDAYISATLRPYVELFSSKSPDWLNYIRFLIVPYGGSCMIGKSLSALDARYASLFSDNVWKESVVEKSDNPARFDLSEISLRILRYISGAGALVQLPLAEAIITNKNKGLGVEVKELLPQLQGGEEYLITSMSYCNIKELRFCVILRIDDTSQQILPFIGEVRVGPIDTSNSAAPTTSTDLDDSMCGLQVSLSGSPPQNSTASSAPVVDKTSAAGNSGGDNMKIKDSPIQSSSNSGQSQPSHLSSTIASLDLTTSQSLQTSASESMDLQVDYWVLPLTRASEQLSEKSGGPGGGMNSGAGVGGVGAAGGTGAGSASGGSGAPPARKELKCSLKTMIRSMQIYRPVQLSPAAVCSVGAGTPTAAVHEMSAASSASAASAAALSMVVVTQEKKQKIMRIGKKSKDTEAKKSQQIDSISRLICTSKSQSQPLVVTVDGTDCFGVKFFQVSAQWQTHVKYFPVLMFSGIDTQIQTGSSTQRDRD